MARYTISGRTSAAPTSTLPGVSLYASANVRAIVRSVQFYNTTATECTIILNRLTSTGTQGSGLTEVILGDDASPTASSTGFAAHSVAPTLGNELMRVTLGAAKGSGVYWVFDGDEGLYIPKGTSNGVGLISSGTGQVVDYVIEWEE